MNKVLFFKILFLISLLQSGYGQRHYITNQYVYDLFLMNPAAAALGRDCYRAGAFFQRQWFGTDLAPTTQMLTFQMPVGANIGSGTYLYNDRNGHNSRIGLQQAVSVEVPLQQNRRGMSSLAFGLSVLVEQAMIDQSGFIGGIGADPIVGGGIESGLGFNAKTGIILTINQFQTGISATNIFPQNNPLFSSELEPRLPVDFHFHAGTEFKIPGRELFIQPMFYLRHNSRADSRMDFNARINIPTTQENLAFWGMLAYRRTMDYRLGRNLGFATTVGINYNQIGFGIEHQLGLTNAQNYFGSAFQVVASYRFCPGDRVRAVPCNPEEHGLPLVTDSKPKRRGLFRN